MTEKAAVMPEKPAADKWSPRVWHRRASRPVSIWMMVFIAGGLTHFLIPNYGWVLTHIFTLGILTNSILVWSQHLTEKFVQQRLDEKTRPLQLYRIYGVNLGAIIVIIGNMFIIPPLTVAGAAIVAALMLWHSGFLLKQWHAAKGKRFRPIVAAYAASAAFLPLGAFFGGLLAYHPGNPKLLIAHIACNLAGFTGLAAAASLSVLFPAIWRSKGITRYLSPALILLGVGVVATVAGALLGFPELGLAVYTAGWVLNWQQWLGNVNTKALSYQSLSALCAVTWFVLTLVYFTAAQFTQAHPKIPVMALLVGFAGQLLIGVMAYLLPTTMGGGPGATRAGLLAMGRLGILRVTFINGGLMLWLASDNSYEKILFSLLCMGSLAVFPFFMVRGVRAQRAVITKRALAPDAAALADAPFPAWQLYLGVGIEVAIWALFTALG
ncbi:copper oxidase [uncultured Corynebacterium sp.]|uniref:copper oxidase n=1 Tax=uncultured Corynebacterium sp. TaxID=159447 RepID=UPI0025E2AFF2|nr:copper oxidase [uncultured Corynebacterium sp.]